MTFTGVITLSYAGLMALSAIVIRLKKNPPDRYKMPLWPIPPALLVIGCVLMGTQQQLKDVYITLGIAAVFLIYYLVFLRPRPDHWRLLDPDRGGCGHGYAHAQAEDEPAPAAT